MDFKKHGEDLYVFTLQNIDERNHIIGDTIGYQVLLCTIFANTCESIIIYSLALARSANEMLNRSDKSGHSCIVSDFFFISKYQLSYRFLLNAFSFLVFILLFISTFFKRFLHEWVLDFFQMPFYIY